jgi:hypothetical protein
MPPKARSGWRRSPVGAGGRSGGGLGYNPGPVDGVYGQRTADAISQYQYASRLPVDGRPSPQLLNFMISQGS